MNADSLPVLPEDIFQTVFEKSPGSLLVKADAPHFTIVAASDSYLEITSSTRNAILGKGFFEVFPDDEKFDEHTNARYVFTKVTKTGKAIEVPTYRFDVYDTKKNESEIRYWSCCNTPILGDDGKVAYILNTVVDITGEVKAKEAAIESESRLRLAAEAAEFATWDLNLLNQTFIYSPRLSQIFGHPPETVITLENIRKQVNEDDMQNIVLTAYGQALKTGNYLYEVRITWPDGSLHWIKTQGLVVRDKNNQPIRMLGTILDTTETKRDEIRKNDFIAMASHELKTPLTSLKAYIQLLSKKLASSDDSFITGTLAKAGIQINKMTDLIYGFLDLSKLEPGTLQLDKKDFEINSLVNDCLAEMSLTHPGHIINFEPQNSITVNADREKIGQVITNFLSNAIKYSNKGSTITISLKKTDNDVTVSVIDNGIGIKLKDQEKLFQRFYRVESERMKNISGFGIGLYLANEIIQLHKGKIGVESAEGRGSTFYFSLPLHN
ncbi:MAG TPA: ATP-binding protein [Mucilaginibacter sp.]|jgi:two-component system sensor histidine kinase VicK|nr:ATP-binding protein [Mucilaginibacter sp.]